MTAAKCLAAQAQPGGTCDRCDEMSAQVTPPAPEAVLPVASDAVPAEFHEVNLASILQRWQSRTLLIARAVNVP